MGGEFPKLRYFTMISKNIVEAERFGEIWGEFSLKRKEFGRKVINSLEGHWGKETLSAHNVFENKHQRILVQRLKKMAKNFKRRKEFLSLARILEDIADSYHLALTFPDGLSLALPGRGPATASRVAKVSPHRFLYMWKGIGHQGNSW